MVVNFPLIVPNGQNKVSAKLLEKPEFRIVLFPLSVLYASIKATTGVLRQVKEQGTDVGFDMVTTQDFEQIVEMDKFARWSEKYILPLEKDT
jgi:2-methylisocitrate lyase-like PEP mutase family enzyme